MVDMLNQGLPVDRWISVTSHSYEESTEILTNYSKEMTFKLKFIEQQTQD